MDRITKLMLIGLLALGCHPEGKQAQADQTIFQPMIFSTGSSLTINSGITVNFLSGSITDFNAGSTVDFTGATVTGLPSGGGNVSNTGTPTNGQLALWTSSTVIQGLTALPAANFPALTGDVTTAAGALATTYNNAVPTAKGGVPTGGTAGQALTKNTATNYDASWSGTPSTTVIAAVTQTATAATAHMTYTVPAGSAQVNTVYHLHAYGDANNGTTAITFTANVYWGGTGGVVLLSPGFNGTTTAASARNWIFDANVVFRTIGASASVSGDASVIETTSDATGLRTTRLQVLQPPATCDTTVAKDLVFGWTLSATTGAPQVRTLGGYIQIVK